MKYKVDTKTVDYPKLSINSFVKIGAFILSLTMMFAGSLLVLTLIGAIGGIPLMIAGFAIMKKYNLNSLITCDYCGNVNNVSFQSKRMKCNKCKEVTPLKWKWRASRVESTE